MSEQAALRGEPDRVASLIYLALSENRIADATDLAEANWPALVSNNVGVLRAVADQLSPKELEERPAWEKLRRYLGFMMLDSSVRPLTFIDIKSQFPPRSLADVLLTLAMRAIAARTAGRFTESAELAATSISRLAEAPQPDQEAILSRLADAYVQWGLSFEFAIRESEALQAYERAYDLGVTFENRRAATDAAGQLAWLHALAGRGRTADKWIKRAEAIALTVRSTNSWRRNDIMAAALRQADRMRPDLALELMAQRTTGSVDEHRLIAFTQAAMFRLSSGRSTGTILLSDLRRAAMTESALLTEENENTAVVTYVEALMHIYADRPDRAIELLERMTEQGSGPQALGVRAAAHLAIGAREAAIRDADTSIVRFGEWPRQLIPALLVKATLALEDGEEAAAACYFTDACKIGVEKGMCSSLVIIPHADFVRLHELAGDAVAHEELIALTRTPLIFAPPRRTAVNLSPRELGVLRELASGGTLAHVAARLHLSVNTLKAHNQAIYRKLGVAGRDGAIKIALERGLL